MSRLTDELDCALAQLFFAVIGWRLNSLYTPIGDGEVVLGALPYSWDVPVLRRHGVRAVVNMCGEYKGPITTYEHHGIEQLWLPTVDGDMPTVRDARRAIAFIRRHVTHGGRVLVHCRCGMGRSATIVLCWLLANGWKLADAVKHLRVIRPEVAPSIARYPTALEIAGETLVGESPKAPLSGEPAAISEESTSAVAFIEQLAAGAHPTDVVGQGRAARASSSVRGRASSRLGKSQQ